MRFSVLPNARWRAVALGLVAALAAATGAPAQPAPTPPAAAAPAAGFVLRGRVLDAETRQPVPNAQVGVGHNRVGTSTNDEGRFALRVPAEYAQTELEVALIGYERYRRPLAGLVPDGPELLVLLRLSPAALGEVTVTASALGIVQQALARVPQNYPTRPTQLRGFLREADRTPAGRYLFVAEATEHVRVPPCTQPALKKGQVRLEQSRKVDLRGQSAEKVLRLNWGAGAFVPLRFDFVRNRPEFLQPKYFAEYAYRVADVTTYGAEPVYVVAFAARPGRTPEYTAGKLFIGANSYAFLGAEARRRVGREASVGDGSADSTAAVSPTGPNAPGMYFARAWKTTYQPFGGRWHLKEVHYRVDVKLGESAAVHTADFLATALDTADARPFTYAERAQFEDVFLANPLTYDSTFWRGYVPPLPETALSQALAAQAAPAPDSEAPAGNPQVFEQAQAAARPAPRARLWADAFWRRLSVSYALGTVGVRAQAATTGLRFASDGGGFVAEGQTTTAAGQRLPLLSAWGYQFDLVPRRLYLRYVALDVAGQYGVDQGSRQFGLGLDLNLRPRHRPLLLRLGLDYTTLGLGREVGTFANSDRDLRLDGTRLKGNDLAVAVQTRTRTWAPRLGLGLELSHRVQLFGDATYLLDTGTATRLTLRETSGFFLGRSEAAASLAAVGGAALQVNDAPAAVAPWRPNHWLVQVGLVQRLR